MAEKQFERGTSLSIFVSDRREDFSALIFAFAIAFSVMLIVG
jgi:hypothetical protein